MVREAASPCPDHGTMAPSLTTADPTVRHIPANKHASAADDADHLWLPPHQMRRYQIGKTAASTVFVAIFVGWLLIQWSNPLMRWIATSLVLVTVWVTLTSVIKDHRRSRGHQLRLDGSRLWIKRPEGVQWLALTDVARARWRQDEERTTGLWFYDPSGRILNHLDSIFLADQAEARSFLGWARRRVDVPFPVEWPQG